MLTRQCISFYKFCLLCTYVVYKVLPQSNLSTATMITTLNLIILKGVFYYNTIKTWYTCKVPNKLEYGVWICKQYKSVKLGSTFPLQPQPSVCIENCVSFNVKVV